MDYLDLANQINDALQLPKGLLPSVVKVESNFNPKARSSIGATGLGQIMPETFSVLSKRYGVQDINDPMQNLMASGFLLKENLERNHGDVQRALLEYHGGPDTRNWGPLTRSYPSKVARAGQSLLLRLNPISSASAEEEPTAATEKAPSESLLTQKLKGFMQQEGAIKEKVEPKSESLLTQKLKALSQRVETPSEPSLVSESIPAEPSFKQSELPGEPLSQQLMQGKGTLPNIEGIKNLLQGATPWEVAGGVIGSVVGTPAAGGVLGAAIGSGLHRLYDTLRGGQSNRGLLGNVAEDVSAGLMYPLAGKLGGAVQASIGSQANKAGLAETVRMLQGKPEIPPFLPPELTTARALGEHPRLTQYAESALGGKGVMEQDLKAAEAAMPKAVENLAGPRITERQAGLQIRAGVQNFVKQARAVGQEYNERALADIPTTKAAITSQTTRAVEDLNVPVPAAVKKLLEGGNIDDMMEAATIVGRKMRGVEAAQYNELYNALRADIQSMAAESSPEAVASMAARNRYWRRILPKLHGDVEKVLERQAMIPDKTFTDMLVGRESAVRNVRNMIRPQDMEAVQAATLHRWTGDKVGPMKGLVRGYEKMTPEARKMLFGGGGDYPNIQEGVDALYSIAKRMDPTERGSFSSLTARAVDRIMRRYESVGAATAAGLLHGATTGTVGLAGGALGINYLIAKSLTKPATRWLSTASRVSSGPAVANLLTQLETQDWGTDEGNWLREELRSTMQDLNSEND